jgi:hypothetical protein
MAFPPIRIPCLDLTKPPPAVDRKHGPSKKKHEEKIQEGVFGSLVRIVDGEYDKNYDEIDDVVEHNLVEWF